MTPVGEDPWSTLGEVRYLSCPSPVVAGVRQGLMADLKVRPGQGSAGEARTMLCLLCCCWRLASAAGWPLSDAACWPVDLEERQGKLASANGSAKWDQLALTYMIRA
jgi:hypothetical protein